MPMSPHPPSYDDYASSPPITLILIVILLIFFFLGFFSVYFCRCFIENMSSTWQIRRLPSRNFVSSDPSVIGGLDPSLIQSFPTFVYSSVKDFREEKYGLECAICLVEFEDDSLLRLLTVCYHVFHQECIDLWLESHKTCPVCRGNLDLPPPDSLEKSMELVDHNAMHDVEHGNSTTEHRSSSDHDAVRIDVKEDENDESAESGEASSHENASKAQQNDDDDDKRLERLERFSKSHSTGHSIVRRREDEEDRFTLRLPEHVKVELVIRGHNIAKSCSTFGEFCGHIEAAGNGGFGEVPYRECSSSGGNIMNKV
ncbi:hypothetical protein I3843_12G064200 [Carya illinoinensis]|nr:hypothetical protein I3843_12G064200 [Carya illinoinensis]